MVFSPVNYHMKFAAQKAFYQQNGYVVLEKVIPKERLLEIRRAIHLVFRFQLSQRCQPTSKKDSLESLHEDMQTLLRHDVPAYLATARYVAKLSALYQLSASDTIQEIMSEFGMPVCTMSTEPVMHIMSEKLKIPNGYFGLESHQDWPSVQGSLDVITMWMPFMDIGPEVYPVQVIPESHLKGLWEGEITPHALKIKPELLKEEMFVSCPVPFGGVLLMNGFTVHRSATENCSGLRIASSTRYENPFEPTFAARGYPCAYKRTVERNFFTPNFPSIEQVQKAIGM